MSNLGKKFFSVIVLSLVIMFAGCTKNVAGPKGDPGEPAKQGNVVLTYITQPASSWSVGGNGWESYLSVKKITDNVLAKGEVEVYMQVGEKWWSLPYAVGNLFMQATVEKELVRLNYFMIHDGPPAKPGAIHFRIVILEPVQ